MKKTYFWLIVSLVVIVIGLSFTPMSSASAGTNGQQIWFNSTKSDVRIRSISIVGLNQNCFSESCSYVRYYKQLPVSGGALSYYVHGWWWKSIGNKVVQINLHLYTPRNPKGTTNVFCIINVPTRQNGYDWVRVDFDQYKCWLGK